jgi:hypothetical protein
MSERMYRVYHKNSETRTVAVTDIVTSSRKKALQDGVKDARRWNWEETRENMRVKFLECEGKRLDL